MPDPYIPRKPLQLLSSADWNDMQRRVREDMLTVEAAVQASRGQAQRTGAQLETRWEQTWDEARPTQSPVRSLIAHATPDAAGGARFEESWGAWLAPNSSGFQPAELWAGAWTRVGVLPSPTLEFELEEESQVLVRLQAWLRFKWYIEASEHYTSPPSGYTVCKANVQLILEEEGQRAPMGRPLSDNTLESQTFNGELSSGKWDAVFTQGITPTTWRAYREAWHKQWTDSRRHWFLHGWLYRGVQNGWGYDAPVDFEESARLPAGKYTVRVGFTTHNSSQSTSNFRVLLYNPTLSALLLR